VLLDAAYLVATALTVAYAVLAVAGMLRRQDVLSTLGAELLPYTALASVGAVFIGQMCARDSLTAAQIVSVALPFGLAATAVHAVERHADVGAGVRRSLGAVGALFALVAPFAAGATGWS
jgi:hypothetical protein